MKKISTVALLITAAVLIHGTAGICASLPVSGGSKTGLRSYYKDDIRIDGRMTDWPSGLFYISSEAQIVYAVANDQNYVYFCLQMTDPASQVSAMRNGVRVWINAAGKKKEGCSLKLSAVPVQREGQPPERPGDAATSRERQDNGTGTTDFKTGMKGMKPQPGNRPLSGRLQVAGFRDGFNATIPVPGADSGFGAAMALDSSGMLVMEGRIPINALLSDPWTAKAVALGFGVELSDAGGGGGGQPGGMRGGDGSHGGMGQGEGMGGGMNPGMGQGGGGGRQGGRPGGGMDGSPEGGPSSPQLKTVKTWYKFSLAPAVQK